MSAELEHFISFDLHMIIVMVPHCNYLMFYAIRLCVQTKYFLLALTKPMHQNCKVAIFYVHGYIVKSLCSDSKFSPFIIKVEMTRFQKIIIVFKLQHPLYYFSLLALSF